VTLWLAPLALAVLPTADPLEEALATGLAELHRAHGFPGATAAFVLADGRSGAAAVGLADLEEETPMRSDSRMLAGSTGKSYCAAIALQLVTEERVQLDDPLSTLFGEEDWFARLANADELTLRMLLAHTSGVSDHVWSPEFHAALRDEPDRAFRPVELVAFVLDRDALFPAGEGWAYADTNYVLAGMVVEAITGESFYDELRARVIEPLELKNTLAQDLRVMPGLIPGYTGANNPFGLPRKVSEAGRHAMNPQVEYCGGGVMSTSPDLARWAFAMYGGGFIAPALMEEVLDAVPSPRTGPGTTYGLGTIVCADENGTSWGHTGWFPGYGTKMAYYPDHGLALAIQVNTDDATQLAGFPHGWGADLARDLLEALE
jgi:D-alanyl-D-alanine carboxypeptidase